jgi:hypothetical protein
MRPLLNLYGYSPPETACGLADHHKTTFRLVSEGAVYAMGFTIDPLHFASDPPDSSDSWTTIHWALDRFQLVHLQVTLRLSGRGKRDRLW